MFYCLNQAHRERLAVSEGFDGKHSFTGKITVA